MVGRGKRGRGPVWNAQQVRALRQHLGLTQEQMAAEMGTRQQTISEWETGQYQPRGTSVRLLALIAERAGFPYRAGGHGSTVENQEQDED
jgi:DNA-binding transcriptional regulator YiaG